MLTVALYLSKLNRTGSCSNLLLYFMTRKQLSVLWALTPLSISLQTAQYRVVLESICLALAGLPRKKYPVVNVAATHQLLETASYLCYLPSYTRTTPSGQLGPEKNKHPDVYRTYSHFGSVSFLHIERGQLDLMLWEALSFNSWLACNKVEFSFCF